MDRAHARQFRRTGEALSAAIRSIEDVREPHRALSNLAFEALAKACREEASWEFQLVVAPLVLARGTASPLNPIALF